MPRTQATTRTQATRRYLLRDQINSLFCPTFPGHVTFGNFEPSGNGGQTLSVFQWVRAGARAPASRAMSSKFNFGTGQRSWAMTSPAGQVRCIISQDGGGANWKQYDTVKTINDGQWHPIGFVWNNGVLKLCMDLEFDTAVTKLADVAFTAIHQGNAAIALGALTSGGGFPNGWEGGLGTMVISPDALTEEDWLNFVYDGISPSNLSLECLMQTPGGNVIDTSGNGHDGTRAGNMVWATDGPFDLRSIITTPRALAV